MDYVGSLIGLVMAGAIAYVIFGIVCAVVLGAVGKLKDTEKDD